MRKIRVTNVDKIPLSEMTAQQQTDCGHLYDHGMLKQAAYNAPLSQIGDTRKPAMVWIKAKHFYAQGVYRGKGSVPVTRKIKHD